ncbi:MAG TPA: phosphohistidine phosphatase SixA [Longimicrobiales bacterium]|nr:phosphohistidine phosphatase SixA [Longimicrobiales bacterium]
MQLLIIRHGRAEDRDTFAETGADDDQRPLTDEGRDLMREAAAGLHRIVESIDVLATSPLLRAQQTARIVADEFAVTELIELDLLVPGSSHADLYAWLCGREGAETVAVVGHNTYLSELAGFILTGSPAPLVEIRKGGAVLLELGSVSAGDEKPDGAQLLWSLSPAHLRLLAG